VSTGDHAELNEQILLEKRHRKPLVRHDPPHPGGGQHHGVRTRAGQELPGPRRVTQVELLVAPRDHLMALGRQQAGDGRADQPSVSGHEHPGAGRQQLSSFVSFVLSFVFLHNRIIPLGDHR
jgi:hypothetical protein